MANENFSEADLDHAGGGVGIDEIKAALYKWASPQILRKSIAGFPEWYKRKLMEDSLKPDKNNEGSEEVT